MYHLRDLCIYDKIMNIDCGNSNMNMLVDMHSNGVSPTMEGCAIAIPRFCFAFNAVRPAR